METLLITGAAGGVGTLLRRELRGRIPNLRLSDIVPIDGPGPGEEFVPCDIADLDAVCRLVDGVDGIVHLGGQAIEAEFETILNANIRGCYHVFEAARRAGGTRVLFASSNHVTGFHARETRLDAHAPLRPDSLYGVSKCFGENLARYYFDKFDVESVSVRIGSCLDEPHDRRLLATWLSPRDFADLVLRVFAAERVGASVVYGASDNSEQWWDNRHAAFLGWQPQDSSEQFRERIEATVPRQAHDADTVVYQGGGFAAAGHFED